MEQSFLLGDPSDHRYMPGIDPPLPPAEVAWIPENIFDQDGVDTIVEYWAKAAYGKSVPNGPAFLVPIPPGYLATAGDGTPNPPYPLRLPEPSPTDPDTGVWNCRPDQPGKQLYGVRIGGPGNNFAIPIADSPYFRGTKIPEYHAVAAVGKEAERLWKERYPKGGVSRKQPPFPYEKDSPYKMLVNIDRILWRWHWRSPFPQKALDLSHQAAPAHYHAETNPGAPYLTIGMMLYESRELNESRKGCNAFGAWRRKGAPGADILSDQELAAVPPPRGACWHAYIGWPDYGPALTSVGVAVPTFLSPKRINLGPKKWQLPGAKRPKGTPYEEVPVGAVPSAGDN